MPRVFEESGLSVTLPDGEAFRFSECRAFDTVRHGRMREMDVGWWDDEKQSICLVEVKDYSVRSPSVELLPVLINKARDCLVMLHAAWCGAGDFSRALAEELPERCRARQEVKLFFVVKTGPGGLSPIDLTPLKDELRRDVLTYATVLGIRCRTVALMDHETAGRRLPITSTAPPSAAPPAPPT